jgi:hypothetical protein
MFLFANFSIHLFFLLGKEKKIVYFTLDTTDSVKEEGTINKVRQLQIKQQRQV